MIFYGDISKYFQYISMGYIANKYDTLGPTMGQNVIFNHFKFPKGHRVETSCGRQRAEATMTISKIYEGMIV